MALITADIGSPLRAKLLVPDNPPLFVECKKISQDKSTTCQG